MHFAIPDTEEIRAGGDQKPFTVYNVHINGAFHSSLRYRQLYRLHEQLKKDLSEFTQLPPFPPKKIFALSSQEKEERRVQLERYIQRISQNVYVSRDSRLRTFLLLAQNETCEFLPSPAPSSSLTRLDIHLLNGHVITLDDVSKSDSANDVRDKLAKTIQLPDDLAVYFGLFLVLDEDSLPPPFAVASSSSSSPSSSSSSCDGAAAAAVNGGTSFNVSIIRQLQDFESPVLSLQTLRSSFVDHRRNGGGGGGIDEGSVKIVVRRCYWEAEVEESLVSDNVALNLLYVEVVSDIERGWILASKEQLAQIESLRRTNSKKELLRLARDCKFYGYVHFKPCTMDYPAPGTRAFIAAGNQELNFRIPAPDGTVKEGALKVTRMRCWRMMTSTGDSTSEGTNEDGRGGDEDVVCVISPGDPPQFGSRNGPRNGDSEASSTCSSNISCSSISELSIEYLIAKEALQWITVTSDQAVCMSMCLQGMVDQLMQKRETGSAKWIERRSGAVKKNLNAGFYMRRDGSTLFESPLAQTLNSSPAAGIGLASAVDCDAEEGDSGVVSLSRTPIEDPRRSEGSNLADRMQRVVAGRGVRRSISDARINGAPSSSTSPNGVSASNKKMSSSRTMPNGFSMAYRHATVAENDAFDGIREDDL